MSLASRHVDDSFLQRAASSIPKDAIFLIEDIDCAFASRGDEEDREELYGAGGRGPLGHAIEAHGYGSQMFKINRGLSADRTCARSLVTLSGLLNVIDGVGSEEGRLFLCHANATTLKAVIGNLATNFSLAIPPAEFSTAELQRYLQGHKTTPMAAVDEVPAWVAEQRMERNTREREEADRRMRQRRHEMQQTACAGPLAWMRALRQYL
ncbi:hypothetical protein B0H14DRAFT_2752246 [Mycena olivaceomarginata]|nr:hypothetical protein B0H14DRAFT_2752246 [Mycena olivaceomarginata]